MNNNKLIRKRLSSSEQKIVEASFPKIRSAIFDYDDYKDHYQMKFLSVFDHWLSEDEALELLPNGDINCPNYLERQKKFLDFFVTLYKKTQVLTFKPLGLVKSPEKINYCFKKLLAEQDLVDMFNRHYFFPPLIIPEMEIIVVSNFDFTHVIYYRNESKFQEFKKLAEGSSLHLLD